VGVGVAFKRGDQKEIENQKKEEEEKRGFNGARPWKLPEKKEGKRSLKEKGGRGKSATGGERRWGDRTGRVEDKEWRVETRGGTVVSLLNAKGYVWGEMPAYLSFRGNSLD